MWHVYDVLQIFVPILSSHKKARYLAKNQGERAFRIGLYHTPYNCVKVAVLKPNFIVSSSLSNKFESLR